MSVVVATTTTITAAPAVVGPMRTVWQMLCALVVGVLVVIIRANPAKIPPIIVNSNKVINNVIPVLVPPVLLV